MGWKDITLKSKFLTGIGLLIVLIITLSVWSIESTVWLANDSFKISSINRLIENINTAINAQLELELELYTTLDGLEAERNTTLWNFNQTLWGQYLNSQEKETDVRSVPLILSSFQHAESTSRQLYSTLEPFINELFAFGAAPVHFFETSQNQMLQVQDSLKKNLQRSKPETMVFNNLALTQWLDSVETEVKKKYPEISPLLFRVKTSLNTFNISVREAENNLQQGNRHGFNQLIQQTALARLASILKDLKTLTEWNRARLVRIKASYNKEFIPFFNTSRNQLSELNKQLTITRNTEQRIVLRTGKVHAQITVLGLLALVLCLFLSVSMYRSFAQPIEKTISLAGQIASGNLDMEIPVQNRKDEIGRLLRYLEQIVTHLQDKTTASEQLARGNLDSQISLSSEEDRLGHSLLKIRDLLSAILTQIYQGITHISQDTKQISSASQILSKGSVEQSSSLGAITALATEVNRQSSQNSTNAHEATKLAQEATVLATEGNNLLINLVTKMEAMEKSADEIKKIVKIIDDIAFQINLLSLNANIEAARAGRYGKGFAVVAEEVRRLAARSAKAVQDTTAKVEESIQNSDTSNQAALKTALHLERILQGSGKVTEYLKKISIATKEQAQAALKISQGLIQIDRVSQRTSMGAQECATALDQLTAQIKTVETVLAPFTLKGNRILEEDEQDSVPEPQGEYEIIAPPLPTGSPFSHGPGEGREKNGSEYAGEDQAADQTEMPPKTITLDDDFEDF